MRYLNLKMLRSGTRTDLTRHPRRSTRDTRPPRPLGARIFPLAILSTCALLAAAVTAGPMMPPKLQAPPQVQGLVGLTKVQILIDEISLYPKLIGITREMIEDTLRERLREVGIRVVKRHAPQLLFRTVVISDPRVPNALAYDLRIRIERDVRIVGVDRTMRLPIYLRSATTLEHKDEALKKGPEHLDEIINTFVNDLRSAGAVE